MDNTLPQLPTIAEPSAPQGTVERARQLIRWRIELSHYYGELADAIERADGCPVECETYRYRSDLAIQEARDMTINWLPIRPFGTTINPH